jgi:hypothetical protein
MSVEEEAVEEGETVEIELAEELAEVQFTEA